MALNNSLNIASQLRAAAKKNPDTLALIIDQGRKSKKSPKYIEYTLKQLDDLSDTLAHGLENFGIHKGMHSALMVKPSLEFFALTFALFKIGAIPIMIDPGIGIKNLSKCLKQSEPEAFIGIPKAHIARILFGWARKTIQLRITVGRRFFWGGRTYRDLISAKTKHLPYNISKTKASETAAILFTSGSTGIPKGAVYTHGIFDAQVNFIRDIYGIEPGERDLATFPLFALFGPAIGMTAIIPDMDASRPIRAAPENLIQAITDLGATSMFASPALIDKLGRYGEQKGQTLPSLKRVISAGAPASPSALELFQRMLNPGVQVFTPYGATEALPVCNIGSRSILQETARLTEEGKGTCLGCPVPGITLEIIEIRDDPILLWSDELRVPAGEIGEITVKGPNVTQKYYNRTESDALAKIRDPGDGSCYHRMGDLGYKDSAGRVFYCGRKSQRVITPGETLFTINCEAIFNVHPKVFRSALVGVEKNGMNQPVLCVEVERGVPRREYEKIREELLILGAAKPHTSNIKTVLFHSKFPVDIRHNAKIFREKLALWARRKIS